MTSGTCLAHHELGTVLLLLLLQLLLLLLFVVVLVIEESLKFLDVSENWTLLKLC